MKIAEISSLPWGTQVDAVSGKVTALYPVKQGTGYSLQNARIADETGRELEVMFSGFPRYWDMNVYRGGWVEIRGVPGAPLVWKEQFKSGQSLKKAKLEVTVVTKDGGVCTPMVNMLTPSQAAAANKAPGATMPLDFANPPVPSVATSSAGPNALPITDASPHGAPVPATEGNATVRDEIHRMVVLHRMVVEHFNGESLPAGISLESAVGLVYVQATREGLHHKLDIAELDAIAIARTRPHLARLAEMIRGKEERAEVYFRLSKLIGPEQSWRDLDEVAAERACQESDLARLLAS